MIIDKKFVILAKEVVKTIRLTNGKIHVVGQYDCDGIASSGIICHALKRLGKEYTLSLCSRLSTFIIDKINQSSPALVIFSDLGSGQKHILSKLNSPAILIDHHIPDKVSIKNVIEFNPNPYGLNGSIEVCSSSLAYFIVKYIDQKNIDLAQLAIAGIIGDRQHFGGLKGFNKLLIDEASENGKIRVDKIPSIFGENVGQAICDSLDPYVIGYSGNIKRVKTDLEKLNINPHVPLDELNEESLSLLKKWLNSKLCEQKNNNESIKNFTKRYWLIDWDMDASELHWLLDSCGRNCDKETSIGVLNNVDDSMNLAMSYFSVIRKSILDILNDLNLNLVEIKNIQYFQCKSSDLKGLACGFAIDWFLNPNKPVFGFASDHGKILFSARGTNQLVESGLDLSNAVGSVTKEFGGSGGGHAIAAGGRIPKVHFNDFLIRIDNKINTQLKYKK